MNIQNLINRKSYIIAKITSIAGSENVKRYMELMLFKVECSYNGTIYELVMDVHFQLRTRSRKISKVAESFAAKEERTGIERLSYGDMKWGIR